MNKIVRLLFLSLILLTASALLGADVPYLTGRVTDNAQILSFETQKLLTDTLKAHEKRTGNQIAILTLRTLDGESIEGYAERVFKEWKLGQKGKDNGILIIVVPNDRRMRIEVGYGLEGTMTDLMAGRIIRDVITPKFKNGDYNGGIINGAQAVIKVLEGDQQPDSASLAGTGDQGMVSEKSNSIDSQINDTSIIERILLGCFIFGIIGLFTFIGIVSPGVGWFLYFFLIPFWAMFPIVVLGTKGAFICLITYLIVFPAAKIWNTVFIAGLHLIYSVALV